MSGWHVELSFVDGKSKKFWNAKTEGSDLHVNYGRIGTDGRLQTKSFADADAAQAELQKQAASKRKKGYVDVGGGSAGPVIVATPVVVEDDAEEAPKGPVTVTYAAGERTIECTLEADGTRLETRVVEVYGDEKAARAALAHIHRALLDDGYR